MSAHVDAGRCATNPMLSVAATSYAPVLEGSMAPGTRAVFVAASLLLPEADCASDEDCNGVEGTVIEGCRPSSDTTSGSGGTGGKK